MINRIMTPRRCHRENFDSREFDRSPGVYVLYSWSHNVDWTSRPDDRSEKQVRGLVLASASCTRAWTRNSTDELRPKLCGLHRRAHPAKPLRVESVVGRENKRRADMLRTYLYNPSTFIDLYLSPVNSGDHSTWITS